ncbi:hypothetical protein B0H13DRAFT_1893839 [Mycena leptocephala]|nr:hypothetical protein B0H13DRAFT_1893839 [Mycena leptocephala]
MAPSAFYILGVLSFVLSFVQGVITVIAAAILSFRTATQEFRDDKLAAVQVVGQTFRTTVSLLQCRSYRHRAMDEPDFLNAVIRERMGVSNSIVAYSIAGVYIPDVEQVIVKIVPMLARLADSYRDFPALKAIRMKEPITKAVDEALDRSIRLITQLYPSPVNDDNGIQVEVQCLPFLPSDRCVDLIGNRPGYRRKGPSDYLAAEHEILGKTFKITSPTGCIMKVREGEVLARS